MRKGMECDKKMSSGCLSNIFTSLRTLNEYLQKDGVAVREMEPTAVP